MDEVCAAVVSTGVTIADVDVTELGVELVGLAGVVVAFAACMTLNSGLVHVSQSLGLLRSPVIRSAYNAILELVSRRQVLK